MSKYKSGPTGIKVGTPNSRGAASKKKKSTFMSDAVGMAKRITGLDDSSSAKELRRVGGELYNSAVQGGTDALRKYKTSKKKN